MLDDDGDAVHVMFESGARRSFDLVVGADGLHSDTRRLALGLEEPFHRYLGHVLSSPVSRSRTSSASTERASSGTTSRGAVLYTHEPGDRVHGFLTFTSDVPPFEAFRDPRAHRESVAPRFPEQVWHVPRLVKAMRDADDLFFDIVSQIHMPT
ncbi:hypothetical protein ACFC5Z_14685 [Streptomyces sp. NPDC056004]|uniref:hypothetical protein n=1 Tax=unclassified Streptomyces TaxID=2593676 RepID=UPI0035D8A3EA